MERLGGILYAKGCTHTAQDTHQHTCSPGWIVIVFALGASDAAVRIRSSNIALTNLRRAAKTANCKPRFWLACLSRLFRYVQNIFTVVVALIIAFTSGWQLTLLVLVRRDSRATRPPGAAPFVVGWT